jgi:hypothetical protein
MSDAHVDGDEGLVDILEYHAVEERARSPHPRAQRRWSGS